VTDTGRPAADPRPPAERARDHAAIDRLADELIPALIAKLGVSNLGELEIREGEWRVRVRRSGSGVNYGRRSTDRPGRASAGHDGHPHPGGSDARSRGGHGPGDGVEPGLTPVGPGRPDPSASSDEHRAIATSPAVGVFQPAGSASTGTRVRAGDRIGAVDMLGVPHEVIAPADGIIGAILVEAGDPVEYGQELIEIERIVRGGSESAS
jgi:acetyl-CoA carboxylase biotin carboxyl carrier protein